MLSGAELLDKTFPPENHLVGSGLLDYNSLLIVGGPPKAYKSFLVSTLAIELVCGHPLMGAARRDNHGKDSAAFPVRKQCRVLMLEQEVGEMDLQARMKAMTLGLCAADQERFRQNFYCHSCDHEMRLDMLTGRDYLAKLIAPVKPDVVIFDPLKEFHYKDENSSSEMSAVFNNVDVLRHSLGFATIISHHTRKEGKEEHAEGPDLLRGSSYVFGKGDSFLMVRPKKREHGVVTVEFTIRRGKPIPPLTLALDSQTLRMRFQKWNVGSKRDPNDPTYYQSDLPLQ